MRESLPSLPAPLTFSAEGWTGATCKGSAFCGCASSSLSPPSPSHLLQCIVAPASSALRAASSNFVLRCSAASASSWAAALAAYEEGRNGGR